MKKIPSALLLAAVVSASRLASAESSVQEYNLEIARQPLEATLKEFSKQTGLSTGFVRKGWDRRDIIVGPLKGRYTAARAMSVLLADTGLTFKQPNELSISVTPRDVVRHKRDGTGRMTELSGGAKFLHLAESQFGADEIGIRRIVALDRDAGLGESTAATAAPKDEMIDEMIVAGSHIRGVVNNTVPLMVMDRTYIDSTGLGTTAQLIESLPQNFALASQSSTALVPGNEGAPLQGSGVNLRGIGQGTTLVLLNGRRMASGFFGASADVSALPLSAIERVEVLTDGASALYGSDAVGGVVNFVLRSDFSGGETQLRSGWADGGVNEYRLDQLLGTSWDSGNALMSLEYYKRDLLWAKDRDWTPIGSINSLTPQDENYSGMLSGHQDLSETVNLFFDALYSHRRSLNYASRTPADQYRFEGDNSQLSATMGVDWKIGAGWEIETSGAYASNKAEQTSTIVSASTFSDPEFEIESAQLKADGQLFNLPGGEVSLAVGAEWRAESFRYRAVNLLTGARLADGVDSDQIVRSAFAELYVPILGGSGAIAGARRLEVSLAGRLDDYSNFGSSFDPQVGLMWEPIAGLRLRASSGTSYKAPNLADYNVSTNRALAVMAADPQAPSGRSYRLQLSGIDVAGLSPQESESSSFGLEFTPSFIDGLQVGLNYYKIEYTDRVAQPQVDLNNPAAYGSLINRNPSVAQVNEAIALGQLGQGFRIFNLPPGSTAFSPSLVNVLLDTRKRNLSLTRTSGLDVSLHYSFSALAGTVQIGLDGTHIHELVQRVTATAAPNDTVDTVYNPADWRARGSAGWQSQSWAANVFVNYTDSYADIRGGANVPISSYTTVDARLAYRFKERFANSFLSGLSISAFAQNLFDANPPQVASSVVDITGNLGFDPANANPLGRLVGLEISVEW